MAANIRGKIVAILNKIIILHFLFCVSDRVDNSKQKKNRLIIIKGRKTH